MSISKLHGLYDAIFYIYNNGMLDYVAPLEELLLQLMDAVAQGHALTEKQITLGNKILVYISGCLAGRAYPSGNIPNHCIENVKFDVFNCVISLHSRSSALSEDEPTYPYIRTLLHFDAKGLFNVVSMAFEEPEFRVSQSLRKMITLIFKDP